MESSMTTLIAVFGVVVLGIIILVKTAIVVPQQSAFVVERLGKFKIPKYLAVIESLPRTPASEKIQKFILQKKHGNADNT